MINYQRYQQVYDSGDLFYLGLFNTGGTAEMTKNVNGFYEVQNLGGYRIKFTNVFNLGGVFSDVVFTPTLPESTAWTPAPGADEEILITFDQSSNLGEKTYLVTGVYTANDVAQNFEFELKVDIS